MKSSNIIDKIRKLLSLTPESGATEGEIENAMVLAQKLMRRYNIEEGDIGMTLNDVASTDIPRTTKFYEGKIWQWDLIMILCEAHGCRALGSVQDFGPVSIVGMEADRKMVESLYNLIMPQVRRLCNDRYDRYVNDEIRKIGRPILESPEKIGATKKLLIEIDLLLPLEKFAPSYHKGFAVGMNKRLTEEREAAKQLPDGERYGIILVRKDDLIQQFVDSKFKVSTTKTEGTPLYEAPFKSGKSDGEQKSMSRQIAN